MRFNNKVVPAYPPGGIETIPASFPAGLAWHVVYTNIKCEFRAAGGLRGKGFDVFCPTSKVWIRHAKQKKVQVNPLFPRYIFVAFDVNRDEWFHPVTSTDGVEQLLRSTWGIPLRVPAKLIEELAAMENMGVFDDTTAVLRLCPGEEVRVVKGPFAGFIGKFKGSAGKRRAEILLEMLGSEHVAKLAVDNLRTVSGA